VRGLDYALKRVGFAIITLFVVITMNFFLFRVLPGNAVTNLGRDARLSPGAQHALRVQFGLDKSVGGQYLAYLGQLVHGNLGISYQSRAPVLRELWTELKNTVPMVGIATLIAVVLGMATGVIAAWRRRTWADQGSVAIALMFYAMPVAWLGLMLLLLFNGALPAGGMYDDFAVHTTLLSKWADAGKHMILPAATLALGLYGQFTVITRSAMLETIGEDYVLIARAKGLSNGRVISRHVLPNALLPITTLVALSLGFVVGGAILVETVFSWPGIGQAVFRALAQRDYPILQGAFLLLATSVILCNLIADLLYLKLDPRTVT
jgi:ABC-type dipeptide/oligopeptide/nickel transport system permease component